MKNKKISKRIIRNNLVAYSFVIVSLVTLLVLVYIPMISTVDYSFRRIGMVGVGEDAWIGLENYRMLFSQPTFWKAIGNTILMAVMGLLTIPVGFLLAVLVNSLGRSRLQEFFRVGFYLPNIITGVSVYLIFRVVLMTDGGLLNNVLSAITGRQVSIGWLADPKFARWGVTIIWVWMNAGYSMLMNLASLQAIPADLYEAASIDGANAIQKLIAITVPNMKSCFALLFVTGMINGLARFTDIYILGGMDCYGGAGGTLQTILMYVFQFSFETPNYGVASAGSMVLFALVFVMTMINPHIFDMLRWCTGSDFDYVFADVADNIRDIEEEDVLYVTGQMKNGCKFLLDPSWSRLEEKLKRPGPGWEILPKRMEVNFSIVGTDGVIQADCFGPNVYFNGGPNNRYTVQYTYFDEWIGMMDEFHDCILNHKQPKINLQWHRQTVEAMVRCYDSIASGEPVYMNK